MKKMRGIVDPLSLGFILSVLLAGVGATSAHHNKANTAVKAKAHSVQSTQQTNYNQKEEFASLFSK